ncbi:hypothetical protein OQ279_02605 [Salinimicrobium sp. MT39]|uniref:Uncharacterized protein n=1 Tax=Salinimicrobium profundisediminis TaxID=2994553 RepID=A0A9X3CUF1_9FLAO|nr:hypothetical protein [Salinimicrobium profundisediminis]MCX2837032.1 hypothetical protein [Salinimicrobium profundisediminis]
MINYAIASKEKEIIKYIYPKVKHLSKQSIGNIARTVFYTIIIVVTVILVQVVIDVTYANQL